MAEAHEPLPWRNFEGDNAARVLCQSCQHVWVERDGDAIGCEFTKPCPRCHSTLTDWRYSPADECANCGKMDYTLPMGKYCSRRCQLQGEYADALGSARVMETGPVVPIGAGRLSRQWRARNSQMARTEAEGRKP